jgi:hypothetical protein
MTRTRRETRRSSERPHTVLVVALPAGESDDLIAELQSRKDLRIVLAWGPEQARRLLERPVPALALALATPDVPTGWVDAVLGAIARHRPGTPLLALRDAAGEQPASWGTSGVAVLRCPLLPFALSRSIDVLLQWSRGRPA